MSVTDDVANALAREGLSVQPRLPAEWIPHSPEVQLPDGTSRFNAKQALFLSPVVNQLRDVYYGGAAGGGKSDAILMAALQFVDDPGYSAVIVRKTYPMLDQPGGLIQRALEWLTPTRAVWNTGKHRWSFPSGSTLSFRHMTNQQAIADYQGSEYDFVGVDEVTDFSLEQFVFLFSRLRRSVASTGIPLRVRSASNPIGPGRAWVEQRYVRKRSPGRLFIAARLEDNPALDLEAYDRSLRELGDVTYQQLRWGDWDVKPEGVMFKRHWFPVMERDLVPTKLKLLRRWDLAATETPQGKAARAQNDPDWTVGLLLGRHDADGRYFVLDVERFREDPGDVEAHIKAVASQDGRMVPIRMEQEGGASGKSLISHYRRHVLDGYDFRGVSSTGNKEVRATPVAARAQAGDIVVVRSPWVEVFLDEVSAFPEGLHDDQVDALSGAYSDLSDTTRRARPVKPQGWTAGSHWTNA